MDIEAVKGLARYQKQGVDVACTHLTREMLLDKLKDFGKSIKKKGASGFSVGTHNILWSEDYVTAGRG